MKSIVILFRDEASLFAEEKVFDGKSARDLSKKWAEKISDSILWINSSEIQNFTGLLGKISDFCNEYKADTVIYAYDDLPFLSDSLTKEMTDAHTEYLAEYTMQDGYPYGFAPEIISAGTIKILLELSKSNPEGSKKVSRSSFFNLIKTDINSFEIETVMAPVDWRLFRFNFDCSKKDTFTASKELYKSGKITSPIEAAEEASKNPAILKTVPGFYNIQISESCGTECIYCPYHKCYEEKYGVSPDKSAGKFMSFEKINKLVKNIAEYSGSAVIGLSAWGEPLTHPEILKIIECILSYEGLSVFFETDGLNVTDDFCNSLKTITDSAKNRINGWPKVMVAVSIDSFTESTYKKIKNNTGDFNKSVEAVSKLYNAIPGNVYPQFVRMNENEDELEGFFRYWKEKENPSGGELIIQKYDDFAGLLPECKPADLSPLERNVCWHLRRDMTILANGDVTLCREFVLDGVIGNVFDDGIETVWKKIDETLKNHIDGIYSEKCRKCDEYYTFNF